MKYSLLLAILVLGCNVDDISTEVVEAAYTGDDHYTCEETCGTSTCKDGRNVCHVPDGNPAQAHNICVSSRAVDAHLRYHDGDYCGECQPVCGDSVCDLETENCENCSTDCGECGPFCGDQVCNVVVEATEVAEPYSESCTDCPEDCGECEPVCGDQVCNGEESCTDCPADCGECEPFCGDGECNSEAENCQTCENDCGSCPVSPDAGTTPSDPRATDEEPNLTVEGGGCNASNGGANLLIAMLIGLGLISLKKKKFAVAGIATIALIPSLAFGQDFNTERFEPGSDDDAILNVESGNTNPGGSFGLYTWVNLADDELVLKDVDKDVTVNDIVDFRVAGGIGYYSAISDRLQLGLSLPLAWAQWTADGLQGDNDLNIAMGDLVVAPKLRLLSLSPWDIPVKVSFLPVFTAPTGSNNRGLGGDGVTFTPTLAASGKWGMWRANLNLGYAVKPHKQLLDLTVDDEMIGRAGLAYGWGAGTEVELALSTAVSAKNAFDRDNRNYVEAMAGYRRFLRPGLSMFLGAGRSLADGYGGPDWRAVGGLRFSYESSFDDATCGPLGGPNCPKTEPTPEPTPAPEPTPEPVPEPKTISIVIPNTYFVFDRSVVKEKYEALLAAFAAKSLELLNNGSDIRITLVGSTDNVGEKTYNNTLGHKRALAVAKILMDNGIPADLVRVISEGEEGSSRADDHTTAGRASNRNVLIYYIRTCSKPACEDTNVDTTLLNNTPTEETFDSLGTLE